MKAIHKIVINSTAPEYLIHYINLNFVINVRGVRKIDDEWVFSYKSMGSTYEEISGHDKNEVERECDEFVIALETYANS